MEVKVYVRSDIGKKVRERNGENADNFLLLNLLDNQLVKGKGEEKFSAFLEFSQNEPLVLMAVNGIGGRGEGKLAAQMIIDLVSEGFTVPAKNSQIEIPEHITALRDFLSAIIKADREILLKSRAGKDFNGLATFTGGIMAGKKFYLLHLGENRLYLFRQSKMYQITRDQSFTHLLIEEGRVTEEEIRTSIVCKAPLFFVLGTDSHFSTACQALTLDLENEDVLLFGTDGLFNSRVSSTDFRLDEEEIRETLHANQDDLSRAGEILFEKVNQKGGLLNSTIILVKVRQNDSETNGKIKEPELESIPLPSLIPDIYDVYDSNQEDSK